MVKLVVSYNQLQTANVDQCPSQFDTITWKSLDLLRNKMGIPMVSD